MATSQLEITGDAVLQEPNISIGESFTLERRQQLKITALLPPRVLPAQLQEQRILAEFDAETDPFKKFMILSDLHDRSVHLYYYIVCRNFSRLAPFIYTPHVGTYCLKYHEVHRPKRALFFSIENKGRCKELAAQWPRKDVEVIVVTDGGRILGLGDLGCNGIGIPIGKLALYCAAAGCDPQRVLPVQIDVGTKNKILREHPLYLGLNQERVGGAPYDAFVEEVLLALHEAFPKALIQFEDFGLENAFRLLDHWRGRLLTFNDDIQGTGAVTLAALINCQRARGKTMADLASDRIVFAGAGSAGVGIANAIVAGLVGEGVDPARARSIFAFVGSRGCLGAGRTDLTPQQLPYQRQDIPGGADLAAVCAAFRPTILIGVSGQPGIFNEALVRGVAAAAAEAGTRPVIMALSNPTAKAECTPQQVLDWAGPTALYAAGSPFPDAVRPAADGAAEARVISNQCNNMYVFPALGLAACRVGATAVTDAMFTRSALSLAGQVSDEDVKRGLLFPPLARIRQLSQRLAADVADQACADGVVPELPVPKERLYEWFGEQMYKPEKWVE